MASKDRSFTSKMGHQKVAAEKEKCPVCKQELSPIVYISAVKGDAANWSPRRTRIKVCNCNKKEIYG